MKKTDKEIQNKRQCSDNFPQCVYNMIEDDHNQIKSNLDKYGNYLEKIAINTENMTQNLKEYTNTLKELHFENKEYVRIIAGKKHVPMSIFTLITTILITLLVASEMRYSRLEFKGNVKSGEISLIPHPNFSENNDG